MRMTELEKCIIAKERGITYNAETGKLFGVNGNEITAHFPDNYLYVAIRLKAKKYAIRAHRLAWYLHYGELPKNLIDHIDGNPANNKIDNLRDVTNQHNQWNQKKAKGYHWSKSNNKWAAQISVSGNKKHLGFYTFVEDARNAYLEAKAKYHVIPNNQDYKSLNTEGK